jgi:DNA ligase-1
MKPMLACDWDEAKLEFPMLASPKIDGVRGLNLGPGLTGRSLKPHANRFTTSFFSCDHTKYLDGELTASADPTLSELCRLTTSKLNTVEGTPAIYWWIFDCIMPGTPYWQRLDESRRHVYSLQNNTDEDIRALGDRMRVVEAHPVHSLRDLYKAEAHYLDLGYEGLILRDPDGLYKYGRSTARGGQLLRIKRFVEEEAVVTGIEEGRQNGNEAVVNALGKTERSTHQENMVPNGQVGTILARVVKTGQDIRISPGCMDHAERVHFFHHPEEILGRTVKFKHFDKGVKDVPRFPTFQSFRADSDL